ncbi:MAG: hypothetical protein KatS3mg012_1059 [Gaiellaceae bacterium]|nr:MAG: hypothetical protein KatS3mg012_1059 [Gaiellaceae bacterium]
MTGRGRPIAALDASLRPAPMPTPISPITPTSPPWVGWWATHHPPSTLPAERARERHRFVPISRRLVHRGRLCQGPSAVAP